MKESKRKKNDQKRKKNRKIYLLLSCMCCTCELSFDLAYVMPDMHTDMNMFEDSQMLQFNKLSSCKNVTRWEVEHTHDVSIHLASTRHHTIQMQWIVLGHYNSFKNEIIITNYSLFKAAAINQMCEKKLTNKWWLQLTRRSMVALKLRS